MSDTFPRQYARTQRFTLGEPRNLTVSPDGERVVFARSGAGDDPVNCLWVLDAATGTERLIADPIVLLGVDDDENVPAEERLRRERTREGAGGITAYATDRNVAVAAFALSGRLFVAGLVSGMARGLDVDGAVFDPRPDPVAMRVAYVAGRTLRIAELDGSSWELAGDEENADVTLHVLALEGGSTEVHWDRAAYPYLAQVRWSDTDSLLLTVQSRDQRSLMVLRADPRDGSTEPLFADGDPAWVELVLGTPGILADGQLVMCADRAGSRRLLIDGNPATPETMQVRGVLSTDQDDTVYFLANDVVDATEQHVWRWTSDGVVTRITTEPGVHTAVVGGPTLVLRSTTLDRPGSITRIASGIGEGTIIGSLAATPLVRPNPMLHAYGERSLATAVLLPHNHDGSPLPVLLDPYGGPHAQRVLKSHNAYLSSQWFADQGFAVVIIDGRGTPGRGSAFERTVLHDLATLPLQDQVDALHAAASEHPLDLDRVAIRGWSFGGYLAALAVLRRPDVFHAAVAGAPVTEWRLYDTHYTERYLGDPTVDAGPYAASSLLPLADELTRPLLLIHGLADDNVVAAHTLQFSSALLAAGKPHEVLALVGVTHMTPQEVVAENLLLHQLDFLRRSLGLAASK